MEKDKKHLRIKTCVLGMVGTNCHIIYHDITREALIIDPADDSGQIVLLCSQMDIKPVAILLTHGHFDHIMAVEEVRKHYDIPVYAGEQETDLLADPNRNMSALYGGWVSVRPQTTFKDQEVINIAGFDCKVLHTPGHTPGSVCYWIEKEGVLVSGDTLFYESLGRTDFPGGSTREIIASIGRLFQLPDDTMVYSGHGEPTTIGHEAVHNPVARYVKP